MPIGGFIKYGGRVLNQAVDPTNYRFLQRATEDVLSRAIPQGVNFGALPTQFLDTLTNISKMSPGAAKEAARTQAKTTLTRAAKAQAPAPRPFGQGPTGLLRAPSIGNVPARPTTTLAPRTNISGSPLATDYALSRQTGMTQALGQARKAGQINPQNFLGRMMNAGGGKFGLGFDLLNPAPGIGIGGSIAKGLGLTGAAGGATTIGGGLLAAGAFDAAFPQSVADGTLSAAPKLSAEQIKRANEARKQQGLPPLNAEAEEVKNTLDVRLPGEGGGFFPTSQVDSQITPPPAPILPPPPESLLPPEERAYQAELARTQQMMASNPYMPQTQLYAQGQSIMQTPEDMAATRDLGLAINRAMYGNQLTPKTPNPLMAGLTPPPGAQSNIPMDQEGRTGQIDTASEGVQEFMRKYLEGKKKREEED